MDAFKRLLCKVFGHQWGEKSFQCERDSYSTRRDKTVRTRYRFTCPRCKTKTAWIKAKDVDRWMEKELV